MSRRAISDETEKAVLTKSRRRCCLCFWLDGKDEVQKGQIAHLDQNNQNPAEDNLVFLCFDHHDEFDGRTSQSKGLKEQEIRKWRNELYKELEYRFRTTRRREVSLAIDGVSAVVDTSEESPAIEDFVIHFKLRNTGDTVVHNPVVSIELGDGVEARILKYISTPFGRVKTEDKEHGFQETRQDFFEFNGRVAQFAPLHEGNRVLMPEHSHLFEGLHIKLSALPDGTIKCRYRIDAEDMVPVIGLLSHDLRTWFTSTSV